MALVLDGTNGVSGVDGTASNPSLEGTDSNTGVFFPAADTVAIGTGGTEALRVNSSQNVGIGTSSPAEKFEVYGTNPAISIYSDSTSGRSDLFFKDSGGASGRLRYDHASDYLATFTNGAERMRLDASGNLGLGVTPSAWVSNFKAFQVGTGGTFYGDYNNTTSYFGNNAYFDGTNWKYVSSSYALYAYQDRTAGKHVWAVAASGTAGNNITWTEAMTLNASGNLMVGATTSTTRLRVQGAVVDVGEGDTNVLQSLYSTTAQGAGVGPSVLFGAVYDGSGSFAGMGSIAGIKENSTSGNYAGALKFMTRPNGGNLTERARITSGGEVYIAGTTDQGAYNLQCNGTGVWGAGAYVNGSDERIKEDIQPITSGLDVVNKLNPVTYRYKEDWSKDQSTQTGFIAQELLVAMEGQNYVDGVVQQGGSEGYYSVAYQNIIPLLTKAIQELNAKVEALEAQLKGNA